MPSRRRKRHGWRVTFFTGPEQPRRGKRFWIVGLVAVRADAQIAKKRCTPKYTNTISLTPFRNLALTRDKTRGRQLRASGRDRGCGWMALTLSSAAILLTCKMGIWACGQHAGQDTAKPKPHRQASLCKAKRHHSSCSTVAQLLKLSTWTQECDPRGLSRVANRCHGHRTEIWLAFNPYSTGPVPIPNHGRRH
jgi:hypothetical protein